MKKILLVLLNMYLLIFALESLHSEAVLCLTAFCATTILVVMGGDDDDGSNLGKCF